MAKELLVNVTRGEEVRVALVEDGRLEEIYLERDNATSNVGSIYLGKVTNVEGSIQAAFVDFGYGRNGFLHVQDLHPDHFPKGGKWEKMDERVGKKLGRRDRPPIQDCLKRGDRIVVQIIKEGIGTKGPTLTSYPSIPGRFLVAMPGVGQMGVSKNIEDEKERRRLRKVLDGLEPPEDVGFIIRTAGEGKAKAELERDFKYLARLWGEIAQKRKNAKAPALLYSEGDLVTRTVRDVWTSDVDRVIVDDVETAVRIRQFFKLLMPRTKVDVRLYEGRVPLLHATGVEREIETMFSRHVPMANGGSLVIDSTEAIVAIDVNSGKFREHGDAEETAFRMDLEAADEICRQLRLRDLGGIVICDFIDLRYARHRQSLHDRLTENFKRDRAKSRHLMMSEFGIVEITRQRMRPDLRKNVFEPCPWSRGTGYIKTAESLSLDVMRRLRVAAADDRVFKATARLYPSAALHVLNTKRDAIARLERLDNLPIEIKPDESLAADQIELDLEDDRGQPVIIESIRHKEEEGTDTGGQRRRRRGGRGRKKKSQDVDAVEDGIELDEQGLIDLDSLLPLGELKLDEVEQLAADAAAKREEADADPMRDVLEALHRAERDEEVAAAAEADEEEAESKSRRGRRRRGKRRDGDAEVDGETVEKGKPAELDEAEAPAEAADEESGGGRRRRRRRRGRGGGDPAEAETTIEGGDDSEDAAEATEVTEVEGTADAESTSGRRRRRRRSGRRDEGIETEVEATSGEEPVSEGSPESPSGAEEQEAGGRRRRRRRRGASGERESDVKVAVDSDEPTPPDADDVEPLEAADREPAEPEDEEPSGGPRRRRRRRRSATRDDADAPVTELTEVPDPEEEPAEGPLAAADETGPGDEATGGGPRRRRRRRRGSSETPADGEPVNEAAPPVDETQAPLPVEPGGAGDEPEPEPEPEAGAEVEAERPRRRRRSRGKVLKSRPMVVESAVPAPADATVAAAEPDPEPDPEPEPAPAKKAAKKRTRKKAAKAAKPAEAAEPAPDAVEANTEAEATGEGSKKATKRPRRTRKKAAKAAE